jgi:nucleoside-diphosphate-sugar epimerase
MRYFVTGATGFIGGHVVRQLCRAGHEVVALVRTPARAADLDGLGVTLHPGDVADCESMRLGMEGADGVFHIAGFYKIGARDRKLAQRINVEGTRNVLGLMCELRIPKGVYTSTVAVFSDTRGRLVDENYHFDG